MFALLPQDVFILFTQILCLLSRFGAIIYHCTLVIPSLKRPQLIMGYFGQLN